MADTNLLISPMHWVAIDVARYCNAVLIETSSAQRYRFRMTNSAADMQRLVDFLHSLGGRCRVALEPTGDYHRPIAHRLLTAGFDVVSISSVAQSRFREAMYNSWDKNDPKDAAVILEMLKQGRVQQYVDPMLAGHHDIQELSKTYYQISRARTKVQHAIINHHVPLYFPEMHKYWSSTRNEWWVKFMIEFPTPVHVRQHTCQEFIERASALVGRRVHRVAKLTEIWEACADSGALPHDPQSVAVQMFRFTLRHYQQLNELRRQLEQQVQDLLANEADYNHLMSLPGVGPINALTILAEAGNLRRFGHHRQFLKFCVLISTQK
ncbi:IS110 family transposase [Comamonas testosteroni]|uniref:IS110 family transposase n=1 Tax=Comamonas testosteroni TaxID=285 RepID=UPI00265E6DAD|nr:IS110 family transposase [Comamonas testosteroni]WKL14389.1 IS110 family transposase [Comamonas testosteroni]